jgi:hypothetical protein
VKRLLGRTLLVAAVLAACEDTVNPGTEDVVVLEKGLNVFLVVSDDHASTGGIITIEAHVRVVGEALTPTGFFADLHFDPDRLEPVEIAEQQDGVVRAVNLEANPGLARAAGAAPAGLGTETLFAVNMRVMQADYMGSLSILLEELIVLEQGFANLAAEAAVLPEAIPARVTISGG